MKRVNKNKKGFTLLELMLAIAIMLLVSGFFATMLTVIIRSHTYVAFETDLSDMAQLNAQALEAELLRASEIGKGSKTISVEGYILTSNGTKLFNVGEYYVTDGTDTELMYTMTPYFQVFADQSIVVYEFTFKDTTGAVVYTYSGRIFVPSAKEVTYEDISGANTLKYSI